MSAQPIPTIRVSELVKSYDPLKPNAVDDISFEIGPGTVFGLLGPNGAGKTTTIKMILGLVLPTRGAIQLAGYDLAKARNKALRHVGTILEGSRNVYWRLTGALRGMKSKDLNRRIDEVLALVDLSDRADEEVRYLSRGLQQKVALATAILHDPYVLLLDEPTLGLDVQASRTIEHAVRSFAKEQGKTVVLTTHQMALAERLIDHIFVIDKGKKVAEGKTQDVIASFGGKRETLDIQLTTAIQTNVLQLLQTAYPGLSASTEKDQTTLSWMDNGSQKEFLQLLERLDHKGLTILQAGRRAATLEEVFVRLTSEQGESLK